MTYYVHVVGGFMFSCTPEAAFNEFERHLYYGTPGCFLVKTSQLKIWVFAPKKRWYRDTDGKWKFRPIENKFIKTF